MCLIIEAKWFFTLNEEKYNQGLQKAIQNFNEGLRFLIYRKFFRLIDFLSSEVDLLESRIYKILKIKDYFDRLILAVARYYDAILLTEDEDLLNLDTTKYETFLPKRIVNWKTLRNMLVN